MKTRLQMQRDVSAISDGKPVSSGVRDHASMLDRSVIQGFATTIQRKKASFKMKRLQILPLIFSLFFVFTAGTAAAQTPGTAGAAPMTREQAKKERDEFLRMHRYDVLNDNWVLNIGIEAPTSVKSRAEIRADRDEFLRTHRWDATHDSWVPLNNEPRELSKMSREQVRAETIQFARTHRWDDDKSAWVEITPRPKK